MLATGMPKLRELLVYQETKGAIAEPPLQRTPDAPSAVGAYGRS